MSCWFCFFLGGIVVPCVLFLIFYAVGFVYLLVRGWPR